MNTTTVKAPRHPGRYLLRTYLEPLGITQKDLADRLRITPTHVNEVVHGKRGITPETALRLERLFGMSAHRWIYAQLQWDVWHARRRPKMQQILAQIDPLG